MNTNIRSELLQLYTKMESISRIVVAVLDKEFSPQTSPPTIIPLMNTTSPMLGASAVPPPANYNPVMSLHNVATFPTLMN